MKLISTQQCEAISGGHYLIMFTTLTGFVGGLGIGGELALKLDSSLSTLGIPVVLGAFGSISGAMIGTGMVGTYYLGSYVAGDILGLVVSPSN